MTWHTALVAEVCLLKGLSLVLGSKRDLISSSGCACIVYSLDWSVAGLRGLHGMLVLVSLAVEVTSLLEFEGLVVQLEFFDKLIKGRRIDFRDDRVQVLVNKSLD